MNNVLLVGNGFDLAHGLLTKYEHFLYLMKNWDEFYEAFETERKKDKKKEKNESVQSVQDFFGNTLFADLFKEPEKPIDKYLIYASEMDEQHIKKLGNIIKSNSWVNYYSHCEAEIDGWIDFEKEVYPVIELFDFIFNASYEIDVNTRWEYAEARISKDDVRKEFFRTAKLWRRYVDVKNPDYLIVNAEYTSETYGILKKKIIADLRKEFDEFIKAFEIYLHEFVYKREGVKLLKQIKEINIKSVISFNYTLTEILYGIKEDNVHHIHGMIREELQTGKNNMVMGVNEQENQSMDFIYFVKYFQRIQKASGVRYKDFIHSYTVSNESHGSIHFEYVLYIYGHSLDETDADILRYLIGDFGVEGINLKPKQVIIFYYDDFDYEQKVINLIKLYGRPIVEEYMEKELFKFVPTSDEKVE